MADNERGPSLISKYVWVIETINRRPEYDFQQELLWNGEDMEVLELLWLRKEVAGKIKRMWNKYKED